MRAEQEEGVLREPTPFARDVLGSLQERRPLLAIVRGNRGSGRSTLLSDVADRCRAAGVEVRHARCHVDESGLENGVVRQLLAGADHGADHGDGSPESAPGITALDLSAVRDAAASAPVAVLVDDLNYVDGCSLAALTYLARRLDDRAITMVVTVDEDDHRTPALLAELTRLPYTRVHTPAALSCVEEAAALATAVGRELTPRTLDIVRCATRGNPQVAFVAGMELAARLPATDEPPEIVHQCCALATWHTRMQWVEQSHPDAANLYRAMLVVARDADLFTAAALCDLRAGVAQAQRVLVNVGLLAEDTLRPYEEHRVHHYGRLNPQQTVDLHRRAADLAHQVGMSARIGASHLMHSNHKLREDDLVLLSRAAHEAELTGDWGATEGTLRLALSQCEDGPTRNRLLLDLHHVHLRSDVRACTQSTLAIARAGAAHEVTGRELASLTHLLPAVSFTPVSAALTALADDMDTAGDRDKQTVTPPTLIAQADLLRLAPRRRHRSRRAVSDPAVLTTRALRLAAGGQHRACCRHLLRRVVPDPISLADRDPMLIGLAALAATWAEDLSSATLWATEGAAVARADHRPVEEAVNVLVRSVAAERIGRPQAALADSDDARVLFEAVHADALAEFARAVHAEACLQLGQIERATITLDGLRPRADAHPLISATVAHTLGRLAAARGDAAGALAHLMSCPRYLHPIGLTGPSAVMWQPAMVRVLVQSGREDAACLVAEGHLATARAWGAPGVIGLALHTRAACATGLERLGFLRAAEDELARAGVEFARRTVLTELAEGYAEHGDDDAAQWALAEVEKACTLSTSEPAGHDAGCAGVRLSGAEQRVVDLVLEGHSNAGVAGMLYLSKRTVDTHLGRIYKKLGINSRAQLATALDSEFAANG